MGLFKPNTEKMAKKNDLKGLISALGYDKDDSIPTKAMDALKNIGNSAVDSLKQALDHKSPLIRERVTVLLCQLGWLPSSTKEQVWYSINQREWKKVWKIRESSIIHLIDILKNPSYDQDLLVATAFVLGIIGGSRALAGLTSNLEKVKVPQIQSAIILGIWLVGESSISSLISILQNKNSSEHERHVAAQALTYIGKPTIDKLKDLARNGRIFSRPHAVIALAGTGWYDLITFLEELPYNRNLEINLKEVLETLVYNFKTTEDSLKSTLDHHESAFKFLACSALGNMKSSSSIKLLVNRLYDKRENGDVRTAACVALGKIGGDSALNSLIDLLSSQDEAERLLACIGLIFSADKSAIRNLNIVCEDKNVTIRALAQIAFEKSVKN